MPFKSQAQRAYLYSQHPSIAERFRKESGPQKGLPERVGAKSDRSDRKKKVRHRRKHKVRPQGFTRARSNPKGQPPTSLGQAFDPRNHPAVAAMKGYGRKRRFPNTTKRG